VKETAKGTRARLVTPVFLLIQLSTFAYFVGIGAMLPVLPLYVKGPLGGGNLAVGLAVGSFSLSALLLRPLAGRLGDARGRRALILTGGTVVALAVAGYNAATGMPALIALRLITGAGEAFFFTGAASAINDLAPDERRGEAVSYFSLALYAGIAVGPVLGEVVLGHDRFHVVWWLSAASALLAAALAFRVPDTRGTERPAGRGDQAGRRGRLYHPAAVLPGFVVAASVWGYSAFASFVPLYALQLGLGGSAPLFVAYSVVVIGIRSVGARLPDRLGSRLTSRIALTCSATGLATMAAWRSPVGLLAGTVVFAVAQALLFPGLMTLAIRSAPQSEMGAVVGTFTAFFDLAYGLGAVSLGAVATALGYRGAFAIAAVVAAGGLVLLLVKVEPSTSVHRDQPPPGKRGRPVKP
jgi:MFS family permease